MEKKPWTISWRLTVRFNGEKEVTVQMERSAVVLRSACMIGFA
jgi:hypothetical protein